MILILFIPTLSFATTDANIGSIHDEEIGLSTAETEFLLENEIPVYQIENIEKDSVKRIMRQAEAYDFSSEQIQALVSLELSEPDDAAGMEGTLSEDGMYFTYPDGTMLPNLHSHIKTELTNDNITDGSLSTMSLTGKYSDVINSEDQSGVYWAVKSEPTYTEATAFIELPEVVIDKENDKDRPYMFLAANSFAQGNSLTFIGDYGVVYMSEHNAWVPFINASQWYDPVGNTEGGYSVVENATYPEKAIPADVKKLYLHIRVTNGTSQDTVTFTCLNGDDFSKVYMNSVSVQFDGNPVQPGATNLNLYHETTMAQLYASITNPLNSNTGTYFTNAKFSQAYLYNDTTTTLWNTNVTSAAYRQAPSEDQLDAVTVNSYAGTKWYADDVSIRFNIP